MIEFYFDYQSPVYKGTTFYFILFYFFLQKGTKNKGTTFFTKGTKKQRNDFFLETNEKHLSGCALTLCQISRFYHEKHNIILFLRILFLRMLRGCVRKG